VPTGDQIQVGDELDLVQIGPEDVNPAVLAEAGHDVQELVGRFAPVTHALVDLAAFPQGGWREVSRLEPGPRTQRFRFIAPSREDPAGWALLTYMTWPGGWHLNGDPGPLFPRPGRPTRRRNLRLCWARQAITAPTGSVPHLSMTLHNLADEPWAATDALDTMAYLLDRDGDPLPQPSVASWEPKDRRAIASTSSITIIPTLTTLDVERLPAGRYQLEAVLTDLELKSDLGTLDLV
jgi:hypothetical protein